LRFGFGAGWWLVAFLDGHLLVDSLKSGNENSPPQPADFTKTSEVAPGRHLLAIRFISGKAGSILNVAAWRDINM